MKLLAMYLHEEKIAFISARGKHHGGYIRVEELVVRTPEDEARAKAWAEREHVQIESLHVATAEELQAADENW